MFLIGITAIPVFTQYKYTMVFVIGFKKREIMRNISKIMIIIDKFNFFSFVTFFPRTSSEYLSCPSLKNVAR